MWSDIHLRGQGSERVKARARAHSWPHRLQEGAEMIGWDFPPLVLVPSTGLPKLVRAGSTTFPPMCVSPTPTLRSTGGLLSIRPNHGLACLPASAPSNPNCSCSPGCCPWLTHQPCCFSWPGAWSGQPEWPHQPRSQCTRWGKGEGKSEWPRAVATKALLWLSQVNDSNQFEKTRHQVT